MNESAAAVNAKKNILTNSLVISAGGLIAKAIGALYRIPLTNLLGADGLAVYQTVFPLYMLLLTFSSAGVPTAIAKLVSSDGEAEKTLGGSLKIFTAVGLTGSAAMAALSGIVSRAQGNPDAASAYVAMSPSVVLVAAIACLRGYFQGKSEMAPTAKSQIAEQIVKLAAGLPLCFFFRSDYAAAGAAACFAVTASEAFALVYLVVKAKKDGVRFSVLNNKIPFKRLIAYVIPITLSTTVIPLARMFDSFTAINVMSGYAYGAAAKYGIYTGAVESLIGLPVSVCYGIAAASVPLVGSLVKRSPSEAAVKIRQSIVLTVAVSSAASAAIWLFAPTAMRLLYPGLSDEHIRLAAQLAQCSAVNVMLLSLVQTQASCTVSLGKPFAPCIFSLAGVAVKIIFQTFLLRDVRVNVFALPISDAAFYLATAAGNALYLFAAERKLLRREQK